MYSFSEKNQSPWLIDVYNEHIPFKSDGFLVEIGVGHSIKGIDNITINELANYYGNENLERTGSNTIDLILLGWSGIYIEPVKEYCEEFRIVNRDCLNRIKLVELAASDKEEVLKLYLGDSLIPNDKGRRWRSQDKDYEWIHKQILTKKTSDILSNCDCPKDIDLMSIDAEGFDDRVIKGIDFELHQPRLIIVETARFDVNYISSLFPENYSLLTTDGQNSVWINK